LWVIEDGSLVLVSGIQIPGINMLSKYVTICKDRLSVEFVRISNVLDFTLGDMDPGELQREVDEELARFKALTIEVEDLESEVARRMRTYEELLNSYMQALQIIKPKMDPWRAQRREKANQLITQLRAKWHDLGSVARSDPRLNQDERFFQAIVTMQYKKPEEQKAFQRRRAKLIADEIAKIQVPRITSEPQ
jgi:hypothetical protein